MNQSATKVITGVVVGAIVATLARRRHDKRTAEEVEGLKLQVAMLLERVASCEYWRDETHEFGRLATMTSEPTRIDDVQPQAER